MRGDRPHAHRTHFRNRHTVGHDRQKCKETSSPLADIQQKTCEHLENIKFS